MRNLRLALRGLLGTPFVSLVAIVSLALGIGANAAMFSLFDQMLLRPLPVRAPAELVNLSAPGPKPGSTSCNQAGDCDEVFSYPMFRDLERVQTSFTGLAAHRLFSTNLSYKGQTLNGEGVLVSGGYFPLLGVTPALGRLIGPEDDRAVDQAPVAVLSHAYWRTRFSQDPGVLNQTLIVNGQALTIVGVAPPGFDGTTLGARPQVYVPITLRRLMQPGFDGFENRRSYWAYVFGRLRPGVTREQAAVALNVPYQAILQDVEAPLQTGMSDQTMQRFKARQVLLADGFAGQSSVDDEARVPLALLMGVTGLVLLIACANIANLLLVRGAGRAGEVAVRLSLGARRGQLVSQLLVESLVLAVLGGLLGLVAARWTLAAIVSILPPEAAATIEVTLSTNALLFTATLALGTGLLFGLFPALNSTRPDLVSTLKDAAGQRGVSKGAARFRTTLATVQIALSMALLVGAGLFTRSLMNVSRVDLGIDTTNVVTFGVSPELNGYSQERSLALFERLEDELAAIPGVTGVTAGLVPLLSGSNWGTGVRVQGFEVGPDTDNGSRYNEVGPSYFTVLGMPLVRGREFTRADAKGGAKVAVVNEAFARKFNLGDDAVGKRMGEGGRDTPELDIEIIGLVKDAKYSEVKQDVPPLFFRPYRQGERTGSLTFYVRTGTRPEALMAAIQGVVGRIDPNLPVENLKTLPQQVRENVFLDRVITTLSAAFAILATLLAAVGLYGVIAYSVAQRTREIGLRMALGASVGTVRRLVLAQVGWMVGIGGLIGLAGAIGLGRVAESLLFRLDGHDPAVLAGSAVLLTFVALGAGLLPAVRASRIDPMTALRYE
ncbi:MAG: ABC transporter permease [Acidobacteriota bacterium]